MSGTGEVMTGCELISVERKRQIETEGWTPEHDDQHEHGEMAAAAQCYLEAKEHQFQRNIRRSWDTKWPWETKWWKPKDRISNLVRAGALIAAEIDRIQRRASARELTIVSAAVCKNGKVYTGKRHAEIIPQVFAETGERVTQEEQGFVASDGRYFNRFQAGAVAYCAGQTKTRRENLLSEDLW